MLKYFLLLVILPIILISVFGTELYGQIPTNSTGLGVLVTADANSDTITVTGHTDEITQDVTFRVTSPSRHNTVAIDQVLPDDNGDFVTEFKISSLWSENGFYEIKAKQTTQDNTLYIITVFVEVNNRLVEETEVYRGSYVTSSTLTITTDKPSYLQGETISITGQIPNVYNNQLNISLTSSTHGLLDTIDNITITNNQFATSVNTGNNTTINTAGSYTLTANYGTNTASTTFDYAYPIQDEDDYFIPDSSYLILSDHEIDKWNRELLKWQNAQNRTDSKTEFYYEKLDTAMIRNQTDKIELYTERIGHSMALSELYYGLIECLQEQLELYS